MARVMIIEDEPTIAMVLEIVLGEEGHEVIKAPNGKIGLALLEQQPLPEIVLLDLFMPGIGGKAVVNTMLADDSLCKIPVVIITGALHSTENLPPSDGYRAIISKPFDLQKVVSTVASLIPQGQLA